VSAVVKITASRRPLNPFDFEGDASMKTSILIAAIAACALSSPLASAQDKAAPDKPAMGMAMGDSKPMAGGDMMQRHQMMENRMSMMQMMMEQMLQHQQAMESVPAK
jgi:hypothetical protein